MEKVKLINVIYVILNNINEKLLWLFKRIVYLMFIELIKGNKIEILINGEEIFLVFLDVFRKVENYIYI